LLDYLFCKFRANTPSSTVDYLEEKNTSLETGINACLLPVYCVPLRPFLYLSGRLRGNFSSLLSLLAGLVRELLSFSQCKNSTAAAHKRPLDLPSTLNVAPFLGSVNTCLVNLVILPADGLASGCKTL